MLALLAAASARPSSLAAGAAGTIATGPLWRAVRPRSRPVALWELRMFFPQRSDRDMQQQLGLRSAAAEDRTSQALVASTVLGLGAGSALGILHAPDALQYVVGGGAAALPFAFLAAGLALPSTLRAALETAWRLDPRYRRRQTYHEAGHFLVGYLLGLQVVSYDADGASSAVRFASSAAGGASALDAEALDGLAVVSLAGVAGEVIACGDAEGGLADLAQLRELCGLARPAVRTREQQDALIRWATLMALTLLQNHGPALERLAAALDAGAPVDACIGAIEGFEST